MTFIDFFAGIGGFRRGMELAGHRCIGFCEADKFAIASYTSMHLMSDEERAYISGLPQRKRVEEAGGVSTWGMVSRGRQVHIRRGNPKSRLLVPWIPMR